MVEKPSAAVELTDKQKAEAENAYHILSLDARARGENWPFKPYIVATFGIRLPMPYNKEKLDELFIPKLEEAYRAETGEEWDPSKYALTSIRTDPPTVGGGPIWVAFKKQE